MSSITLFSAIESISISFLPIDHHNLPARRFKMAQRLFQQNLLCMHWHETNQMLFNSFNLTCLWSSHELSWLPKEAHHQKYLRYILQPADIGWPTGNRKKLSCCQAQLSQATCLAVAYLLSISCRPSYVRRLYKKGSVKLWAGLNWFVSWLCHFREPFLIHLPSRKIAWVNLLNKLTPILVCSDCGLRILLGNRGGNQGYHQTRGAIVSVSCLKILKPHPASTLHSSYYCCRFDMLICSQMPNL